MPAAVKDHVDWIADCITHLRGSELTTVEASAAVEVVAERYRGFKLS